MHLIKKTCFCDTRIFYYLILAFLLFTIIGTITHEMGHYIAARILGHGATINHGFTFIEGELSLQENLMIKAGGVIETLLTGTIGFILLLYFRKEFYDRPELKFKQWIVIFMSLFWLRELFNFLKSFATYLLTGNISSHNDEINLASLCSLGPWTFSLPLALIALLILSFIMFRIVPLNQRMMFMISLLIGGPLGYLIWMELLGPALLP